MEFGRRPRRGSEKVAWRSRQPTKATLPVAEKALAARVDCLRALRNMITEVCEILFEKETVNCTTTAIERRGGRDSGGLLAECCFLREEELERPGLAAPWERAAAQVPGGSASPAARPLQVGAPCARDYPGSQLLPVFPKKSLVLGRSPSPLLPAALDTVCDSFLHSNCTPAPLGTH